MAERLLRESTPVGVGQMSTRFRSTSKVASIRRSATAKASAVSAAILCVSCFCAYGSPSGELDRGVSRTDFDAIIPVTVAHLCSSKHCACFIQPGAGLVDTLLVRTLERMHTRVVGKPWHRQSRRLKHTYYLEIDLVGPLSPHRFIVKTFTPGQIRDPHSRDIWSTLYLQQMRGRWVVDTKASTYVENLPSE
jgi:hypothetical protein